MPSPRPRQLIPLYATGIPGWIAQTLRGAGLPIVELTTRKWHGDLSRDDRPEVLVLFDSRTAASRQNAEAFERSGCRIVNVASFLRTGREQPPSAIGEPPSTVFPSRKLRVLERAKEQIEAAGFRWARLADYPYPFQAALCDARLERKEPSGSVMSPQIPGERIPPQALQLMAYDPTERAKPFAAGISVERLHEHYTAGYAMYVADDLSGAELQEVDSALRSEFFPLLWRASPGEFVQWRRMRRELDCEIVLRGQHFEIRCDGWSSPFRPALELWRGRHFAALPLKQNGQQIDESLLVYQAAGQRHPAGIAAVQAEIEHHTALMTAAVQAF